jgi:hypothetical protein
MKMPVRLRYLAHDIEVPPGQFVVGRSADCQLSLDDPLVSRRHALLSVGGDGVWVEDLGSRNGVLVNGARTSGKQRVGDGDRITIGGQTMTVSTSGGFDALATVVLPHEEAYRRETQTLTMTPADLVREEDAEEPTTSIGLSPFAKANQKPDRRVHGLSLIGGVADKALALNRADDAERILARGLADLLARTESGEEVNAELVDQAGFYAARLAAATGRGNWVDYIFQLYTPLRRLLPATLIDDLYRVVRKVKVVDMALFGAYTSALRAEAAGFGPTERFLQQRIEGLERITALK